MKAVVLLSGGLPMASEFDRQYASPAAVRAARAAVDSLN